MSLRIIEASEQCWHCMLRDSKGSYNRATKMRFRHTHQIYTFPCNNHIWDHFVFFWHGSNPKADNTSYYDWWWISFKAPPNEAIDFSVYISPLSLLSLVRVQWRWFRTTLQVLFIIILIKVGATRVINTSTSVKPELLHEIRKTNILNATDSWFSYW